MARASSRICHHLDMLHHLAREASCFQVTLSPERVTTGELEQHLSCLPFLLLSIQPLPLVQSHTRTHIHLELLHPTCKFSLSTTPEDKVNQESLLANPSGAALTHKILVRVW